MPKKRVEAVAYLRTSSATNVGADKDSDKRQRAALVAFAKHAGFEIVAEFYAARTQSTRDRALPPCSSTSPAMTRAPSSSRQPTASLATSSCRGDPASHAQGQGHRDHRCGQPHCVR